MSNSDHFLTCSHPLHAGQPEPDAPSLAAWLNDAPQPGLIAVIWRLWLPHARAAILLTELQCADAPISATGVVGERSAWLYLWQHKSAPGLHQRLLTDDPNVSLVDAEQIVGGPLWACGRALVRLLEAMARAAGT